MNDKQLKAVFEGLSKNDSMLLERVKELEEAAALHAPFIASLDKRLSALEKTVKKNAAK